MTNPSPYDLNTAPMANRNRRPPGEEVLARVAELEAERDRIRRELEEAKETIKTLELGYRGFQ